MFRAVNIPVAIVSLAVGAFFGAAEVAGASDYFGLLWLGQLLATVGYTLLCLGLLWPVSVAASALYVVSTRETRFRALLPYGRVLAVAVLVFIAAALKSSDVWYRKSFERSVYRHDSFTPESALRRLRYSASRAVDYDLFVSILASERCTTELLDSMLSVLPLTSDSYLEDIAKHPKTSEAALRQLSTHTSYYVRRGVASNPNTPVDILRQIESGEPQAYESEGEVLRAIAENPSSPADLCERALRRLTSSTDARARSMAQQLLSKRTK